MNTTPLIPDNPQLQKQMEDLADGLRTSRSNWRDPACFLAGLRAQHPTYEAFHAALKKADVAVGWRKPDLEGFIWMGNLTDDQWHKALTLCHWMCRLPKDFHKQVEPLLNRGALQ